LERDTIGLNEVACVSIVMGFNMEEQLNGAPYCWWFQNL